MPTVRAFFTGRVAMIKDSEDRRFLSRLFADKGHYPWSGLLELTYGCNLDCVHCYCKGSGNKGRELTTEEWKNILDEIHRQGCLKLTFTGGDPLIRDDFLEIYSYARKKGFLVTIFSNGQRFTPPIIDYLVKSPPFSIEITLNGITESIYEKITQIKGSFARVMETVHILAERKLPLILKSNCLKQNRHDIGRIKAWTENLLGKPSKDTYYFKYDPMIYPRLNGERSPCKHRLSFEEILAVRKQDADIWKEYRKQLHKDSINPEDRDVLYQCDAWKNQFFVNPYGRLKFCQFSEKFSVDLRTTSFKEGFYQVFPRVYTRRFKTNSKCKDCSLRPFCYHCPARAYLETGDEEAPVPYYCELAKALARELKSKNESRALS